MNVSAYFQKSASHHRVITVFFLIFLGVTLVLGVIHETLLAAEVSIVFVRQFKQDVGEIAEAGRRLKKELSTWDDEREKPSPKRGLEQAKHH